MGRMGRSIRQVGGAVAWGMGATLAYAHPGHGETESSSPWHAAEPVHLLPVALVALVVCGVAMSVRMFAAKSSAARKQ